MKGIARLGLVLLVLVVGFETQAMVCVRQKQPVELKPRKLKFKEKAALWILKRKLKKHLKKQKKIKRLLSDTTECDKIYLKTGEVLDVRIKKMTETDVQFVRCGLEDQSLSLSKTDIKEIRFAGGAVVYRNTGVRQKSDKKPKGQGMATAAIILGTLGILITFSAPELGFILALLSFIFAIIGIVGLSGTKNVALGVVGLMLSIISGILTFFIFLLSDL